MFRLESVDSPLRPEKGATAGHRAIYILVDSRGVGGIERHIETLASALRRRGLDARVLLLADHGVNPWFEGLRAANIPFEVNQGGVAKLLMRLRREKAALLHTHGYKAGILGRIVARILSIPVVSTFHAGEVGPFPVNGYQRLDEWTSALAERICVSPATAARLPFRSKVIANFVETPVEPTKDGLPPAVGFVGRLSREKGPDIFCRAALQQSQSDLSWRIYGDGPMRADLERMSGGRVEFRGFVANMTTAWKEIGLLLMPSRAEGLPMAALEALAAGVPVAAARVGALPDVIRHGENGWLFEPGDFGAIRNIVAEWSACRVANGLSWRRSAWQGVKERFSPDMAIEQVLGAYRRAGLRLQAAFR
jgi:glycosyltransferase involved in cell wall biosynthesis